MSSSRIDQDILRELQGCLRSVCLKFQGCLEVSRMFQGIFKCVNRKFLKVFRASLEGISRKFQESFMEFSGIEGHLK